MEVVYYAARANLRRLLGLHPAWTQQQYATAVGMSVGWVKKWKQRLGQAEPDDEQVLYSRSRAHKHPPERNSQAVADRIVAMGDAPPEGLRRTPGPKALFSYLPRDEQWQGERLPRSSRTISGILKQAGRIAQRLPQLHDPVERSAPMCHWQRAFKEASTVPADPEGKRQHVVEVLNVVDVGPSVLVAAQVRADFQAETTLEAGAELFSRHGLPQMAQMDRDGRLVSSPSGSDFPSALVRFCHCLGVGVLLCDAHQPQQHGVGERSHRTYPEECLAVDRPGNLEQLREVTAQFAPYYNGSRPLKATQLRQPPATGGLPALARVATSARPAGPRSLAAGQRWAAPGASGEQQRHGAGGPEALLPRTRLGRSTRGAASVGSHTGVAGRLGPASDQNLAAQRTGWRGPPL